MRHACLLLLALLSLTSAQAALDTREIAVRIASDGMWESLGTQDRELFDKFTSADWQLFTAIGNRFSADRLFEIHRANIRDFRLETSLFRVHIGETFAWATFDAKMSGQRQGEPWGGDFVITSIFQQLPDGRWECVHTHESRKSPAN